MNYITLDINKLTKRLKTAEEKLQVYESGNVTNDIMFDMVYYLLTKYRANNPNDSLFSGIPMTSQSIEQIIQLCLERAKLEFDVLSSRVIDEDFNCDVLTYQRLAALRDMKTID